MKRARRPDHRRLFEVASAQAGYFTASQALACRLSRALLAHHARGGRFLRVGKGLYRLAQYPSSPREEVVAAWLAAGAGEAVVSHESALDLLQLSDVVPRRIHLTVPRSRRYRVGPPGASLHTTSRPFGREDLLVREGVRLTSAARSIVDAAESGTAPEQVLRAVQEALERGLVTRARLLAAARARGGRVERLLRRALAGSPER
ncbi:MAG: type IV toxin-antitoxin system AbiEi family antitoxin domain-containing protein [Planctomycetes bacterium]|nr:type IV toxin-antitoxin system AbiEi family antitoxin domain-containing protein [Planctomycetota bacterium]